MKIVIMQGSISILATPLTYENPQNYQSHKTFSEKTFEQLTIAYCTFATGF